MGTMGPLSGQAITLANSIIGVGILAMPFCFKQCGIILSMVILIGSGMMSRLACHFLLKSAIVSRRRNFEALAYQVFGSAGKFAVEIGIIGFLMGTCVAYFVVVGDLGPQIIAKMLNLNQSSALRTGVMVVVSLVCVLPLGLLRNVDSLSNVCAATIGFYFCLVLKVIVEAGGPLFSGEWMNKVEYWEPAGVLQCLPIFSMALFCQTQLFEIYDTLPNATLEKMNYVTKNAVNICSVMYVLVGLFGYIAFCNQPISGNILLSFSPTLASDAIKMGFVMSLAFSFPLIIFPCRASLYSLLYRKGQASHHELLNNLIPELRFKCLTVGIIAASLLVGLMLPNIELVLGLVGSTIGVMICVIFPATCFICMSTKNTNERLLAQLVLCFGIIIMVLGTYANLQAAEIDSISLENRILAENMHKKITDNKMIQALSPPAMRKESQGTNFQIISDNVIDVNKNAFENHKVSDKSSVLKNDGNVEQPSKADSVILPPNPVPPMEAKVEPKREVIKKPDGQEKKLTAQIEPSSKDDREGAGDREVQTELSAMVADNPPPKVNPIQPSPETLHAHVSADVKDKEESIKKEEEKQSQINDDFKKQELIDTIKRHEEEQRKMVIEQQKILKEIKETQKDIQIKQKAEDVNSAETKKLAVENIQKIAKLAIESLGGQVEITTHAAVKVSHLVKQSEVVKSENIVHQKQEKIENTANEVIKESSKVNDQIPMNNDLKQAANAHIHTKDEPESYKAGEDTINLNNIKAVVKNLTLSHKDNENIANRPPIAIAMSKANDDKPIDKVVVNPSEKPVTVKAEVKQVEDKKIIEKVDNVPQDDYVGGKRDILEVRTVGTTKNMFMTENNNKIAKVHYRNKREILNCPGKIVSNNRGLQICQANEQLPLKLSDDLHSNQEILNIADSINNIVPDQYINMMNSANIVDFHLRNLKSIDIDNVTTNNDNVTQ